MHHRAALVVLVVPALIALGVSASLADGGKILVSLRTDSMALMQTSPGNWTLAFRLGTAGRV